jgi:hypothetical protein
MISELFKDPDKEIIRLRHAGDYALWDMMRILVQSMLEWGFTKRQIHDFVTAVKRE